jgi:glutamine synthetase adenylyltransferase
MRNFAELMRRLLEIQSHEGQRSPELIAEDGRLMDSLQKRSLGSKPPHTAKLSNRVRQRIRA